MKENAMKRLCSLVFVCMLMLAPPLWADQSYSPQPQGDEARQGGQSGEQYAPAERRRLRGDLDDYSREAYPDREKIEERRREMREKMKARLRQADENGDHAISRDEARQHMPRLAKHFDRIDRNGDGAISPDEMKSAREHLRERRRGVDEADRPSRER
jgi:hypothetical protein